MSAKKTLQVALAFIGMTLLLVYADIVKPVKLT